MTLFQLKDGYRYNSDSLFLYEFFSSFVGIKANESLLDVGCGCGVLGLLAARDFNCALTSIDILEQNAKLTTLNAQKNGIKAQVLCADFFEFFKKVEQGCFDKIISNPPFYDFGGTNKNEHLNTSRNAASFSLENFAKAAKKLLKNGGELAFCYDARLADKALSLLLAQGLKPVKLAFLHSKPGKNANLAFIVAKKNSKTPLEIKPPFYACDEDGKHSQWALEVFKKASVSSENLE